MCLAHCCCLESTSHFERTPRELLAEHVAMVSLHLDDSVLDRSAGSAAFLQRLDESPQPVAGHPGDNRDGLAFASGLLQTQADDPVAGVDRFTRAVALCDRALA